MPECPRVETAENQQKNIFSASFLIAYSVLNQKNLRYRFQINRNFLYNLFEDKSNSKFIN